MAMSAVGHALDATSMWFCRRSRRLAGSVPRSVATPFLVIAASWIAGSETTLQTRRGAAKRAHHSSQLPRPGGMTRLDPPQVKRG